MIEKFKDKSNHYRTRLLTVTSPSGQHRVFVGREEFWKFCQQQKLSGDAMIKANGDIVKPPKKSNVIANNTIGWKLVEEGWKK